MTHAAVEAVEKGQLIRSLERSLADCPELESAVLNGDALFEHERVVFPSYPHEWPAEMLAAAGGVTIHLFQRALQEGFGLKDATPYNLLFRGPTPVFVDLLSFEQRDPRDSMWAAYSQFVRTFLLPLLAHRAFGVAPHAGFLSGREGLDPDSLYRWAGPLGRFKPSFLSLVTLPKWMSSRATEEIYHAKLQGSPEKARFVLDHLLAGCEKNLARFSTVRRSSAWSDYLDHKSLYSPAQLAAKEAFVRQALELIRPRAVLDVGANEGKFSFMAAESGASVVAIDADPVVAGTIWREAMRREADVLPLVVDLARPTPALGWRNEESESFLHRSKGHFDVILMLAVLHHLLVTEGVPLEEIFRLLADISTPYALIEFVGPADPMFSRIVRGREALHSHLTPSVFEAAAAEHFEVVKSLRLEGLNRWLYLFRKRRAGL